MQKNREEADKNRFSCRLISTTRSTHMKLQRHIKTRWLSLGLITYLLAQSTVLRGGPVRRGPSSAQLCRWCSPRD